MKSAQSAAPDQFSKDAKLMLDDAQAAGMDEVSMANLREALRAEMGSIDTVEFDGVWPENVPIVEAFLAVSLQWRVVARGGGGFISPAGGAILPIVPLFIGLDYAAVRVGLESEGITITPELWRGLRAMESAAANALNEDA